MQWCAAMQSGAHLAEAQLPYEALPGQAGAGAALAVTLAQVPPAAKGGGSNGVGVGGWVGRAGGWAGRLSAAACRLSPAASIGQQQYVQVLARACLPPFTSAVHVSPKDFSR